MTGAALVFAGLLSVLVFPALALSILRRPEARAAERVPVAAGTGNPGGTG